jgi:hypothetical protein
MENISIFFSTYPSIKNQKWRLTKMCQTPLYFYQVQLEIDSSISAAAAKARFFKN